VTFELVLHEPEIPNNTGNIGRTAVATGCSLHLVRPLGFDVSEKACRRAGLDYWPRLNPQMHDSWDECLIALARAKAGNVILDSPNVVTADEKTTAARVWFFTTKTSRLVHDVQLHVGDALVFGKETKGLPAEILERYPDRLVTLPMVPHERSLNLATAVCAAVYVGIDQLRRRGDVITDVHGRLVR
jgi:tRNA (cytidine/uridine-2'-O-)-methyltransferase